MKQVDYKSIDVSGSGDFDGIDASLDHDNLGFIFDIVSKQMYRRPISSIVREITSNCFDSHIEAGVDTAVLIKFDEDDGGGYISFNDFGVGISPQRMKEVYSVYFKSTKRDTNGQIGFYGLGSKSPLAYTDCFYLNTNFEGKRYEYIVYRGEKFPRIEKILETEIEDKDVHNGTEIKIYFNDEDDREDFVEACSEQLAYFDNVFITGEDFVNSYKIVEGEHFKFRETDNKFDSIHICLGKVYYPIDWAALGISYPVRVPIALKFDIGDLCVTPERESLRYIKFQREKDGEWFDTVTVIKEKLELVKKELEELIAQKTHEAYNLVDFYKLTNDKQTVIPITEGVDLKLTNEKLGYWKKLKRPAPVYVPLQEYPIDLTFDIFHYFAKAYGKYSAYSNKRKIDELHYYGNLSYTSFDLQHLNTKSLFYVRTKHKILENPERIKLLYLADTAMKAKCNELIFITRTNYDKKRLWEIAQTLLIPKHVDYSKYNKTKLILKVREEVYKIILQNSVNYSDPIDEAWLKAYKEAQREKRAPRTSVAANKIIVQDFWHREKTNRRREVDLKEDLKGFTGFLLYGFKEDEDRLEYMSSLLFNYESAYAHKQISRVYQTAQKNEKLFIPYKNAVHVRTFMNNSSKILVKLVKGILLKRKFSSTDLKNFAFKQSTWTTHDALKLLSEEILKKKEAVTKYMETYATYSYNTPLQQQFEDEIVDVVLKTNKVSTEELYKEGEEVNNFFEQAKLLRFIHLTEESLPLTAEFLKLKKLPINSEWTDLFSYEKELLSESLDKLSYTEEVVKGISHLPYSQREAVRYKYPDYSTVSRNKSQIIKFINYHNGQKTENRLQASR